MLDKLSAHKQIVNVMILNTLSGFIKIGKKDNDQYQFQPEVFNRNLRRLQMFSK